MAFTEALLLGVFCFQHETLEKKKDIMVILTDFGFL